ncbi:hypothetical protein MBLNU457_3704t1 [Dothideomycetes sp. NU457]
MSLHAEDAPITGFMALPPEIRIKIYETIMHQAKSHDPLNKNPDEDTTIRYERDLDLSTNKRRLLNAPTDYLGLLSCNKALRTEFGAVFWGTNPFSVVVDSKNSDLRDFITHVASRKPIKKMKLSLVLHPAFNSSFVDELLAFPLLQDLELDIYQGLLPKNAAVGALYLATALRKFVDAFRDLPEAEKPARRVLRVRRIVVLAGSKMNTSKGYDAFVRRLYEKLNEVFEGCEESERWSFKPENAIVAQEYRYGCDRRKFEVLVDGQWIDWY